MVRDFTEGSARIMPEAVTGRIYHRATDEFRNTDFVVCCERPPTHTEFITWHWERVTCPKCLQHKPA